MPNRGSAVVALVAAGIGFGLFALVVFIAGSLIIQAVTR